MLSNACSQCSEEIVSFELVGMLTHMYMSTAITKGPTLTSERSLMKRVTDNPSFIWLN